MQDTLPPSRDLSFISLASAVAAAPPGLPEDDADAALARSAAAGSKQACTAIWRKYAPLVRSKLRRSVGGPDVEDHVQDVFSRLFESLPHLRKAAALRSFLIGITLRVAGTELRRRHGQSWLRLTVDGNHPEATDWNAHDPVRWEALSRLDLILEKLGPHGRRVFELRYIEGKELVEVARMMEISLATTKRHLSRVSLRLFSMVDREPALTEYFKPRSIRSDSYETRASVLQETLRVRKAARAAKAAIARGRPKSHFVEPPAHPPTHYSMHEAPAFAP
jgi:RNA polymerase sigma-70 factor (ECF subfamily)